MEWETYKWTFLSYTWNLDTYKWTARVYAFDSKRIVKHTRHVGITRNSACPFRKHASRIRFDASITGTSSYPLDSAGKYAFSYLTRTDIRSIICMLAETTPEPSLRPNNSIRTTRRTWPRGRQTRTERKSETFHFSGTGAGKAW